MVALGLFFFCNTLVAQFSLNGYKASIFSAFANSKTLCVVKTKDSVFDKSLADAIDLVWRLKPVKYIDSADYKNLTKDKSLSFLYIGDALNEAESINPAAVIGILTGGFKYLNREPNIGNFVSFCVLNRFGDEKTIFDCKYRLPILVKQLESTIVLMTNEQINGNIIRLSKIYSERAGIVKTKILLVNIKSFNGTFTEEQFKYVYNFPYEFCDQKKIEEAIINRDPNYLIFQPSLNKRKFFIINDAASYDCVYAEDKFGGFDISLKEFGELNDKIKSMKL